jgi:hypothetical protein
LFEEITTKERESEEYDAKENSRVDPLTQKFRGLALNQTSASDEHRAEQEFQAQPSDEKKRPMSRISSDAILDNLRNRLSEPALPTVPCTTSQWLQLADSTVVQPYGIAENVLIEFQDSLTLIDFMVVDMNPHQQTSIILGKPFLKSVRGTIYKMRGTINMKVDGVHEKFIYHPRNLACCCQIRVHRYPGSRKVRYVEVIPEHMRSRPQP